MTEHETSESLTPKQIFERYMVISPHIGLGAIERETLKKWWESLETAELEDPEEQLLAAWVTSEYGFALAGDEGEDAQEYAAQLFGYAGELFRSVAQHSSLQVNGLMRGQAFVARGATGVWAAIARREPIAASVRDYMSHQAVAGKYVLRHGETTGSARAAMWADALTLAMLSTEQGTGDVIFPASPRHMSPDVDGWYRHNAFGIDAQTGRMYLIRVADDGPRGFIVVPQQSLGHSRYQSRSGYGTLEAIVTEQSITEEHGRVVAGKVSGQRGAFLLSQIAKTRRHTAAVDKAFRACIEAGKKTVLQDLEPRAIDAENPRAWFASTRPGQYPFLLERELVDEAISPLEMQFMQGELPPHEAMELAWMYADIALGRAVNPDTPSHEIRGDIARSEEIFGEALAQLEAPENSLLFCEASFGFASLRMYEAVLCGDEISDEMQAAYLESLSHIGRRAIQRYDALKVKTSPEAQALDALVQRITLCLLAHTEGGGAYIALSATPRQQAPGGWDVNVWSQKEDGFTPGVYGRIRVAEKENAGALGDGIVTITPRVLNQNGKGKRSVTYEAVVDPVYPQREKQIGIAWAATSRAIEAVEV